VAWMRSPLPSPPSLSLVTGSHPVIERGERHAAATAPTADSAGVSISATSSYILAVSKLHAFDWWLKLKRPSRREARGCCLLYTS
jgi:hypothetical protein